MTCLFERGNFAPEVVPLILDSGRSELVPFGLNFPPFFLFFGRFLGGIVPEGHNVRLDAGGLVTNMTLVRDVSLFFGVRPHISPPHSPFFLFTRYCHVFFQTRSHSSFVSEQKVISRLLFSPEVFFSLIPPPAPYC